MKREGEEEAEEKKEDRERATPLEGGVRKGEKSSSPNLNFPCPSDKKERCRSRLWSGLCCFLLGGGRVQSGRLKTDRPARPKRYTRSTGRRLRMELGLGGGGGNGGDVEKRIGKRRGRESHRYEAWNVGCPGLFWLYFPLVLFFSSSSLLPLLPASDFCVIFQPFPTFSTRHAPETT